MALTLYKKQKQIYDYLCQYIQRNEFAPRKSIMDYRISFRSARYSLCGIKERKTYSKKEVQSKKNKNERKCQ